MLCYDRLLSDLEAYQKENKPPPPVTTKLFIAVIFQVPRVRRNPKVMGWCVEESLPKPPVNRKEQEVVLTVL